MLRHQWQLLLISVLTSVAMVSGAPPRATKKKRINPEDTQQWAWVNQTWTGDERPYREARREIEQLFDEKKLNEAVLKKYEFAAMREMYKPLPQYRWAYAAYLATSNLPESQRAQKLITVDTGLSRPEPPRTYEYTRVRFLVAMVDHSYEFLKDLGKKLVKREPNNFVLKYKVVSILNPRHFPAEKQLGLRYAQDLIRLNREKAIPNVYTLIGQIYYSSFLGTKRAADADKAIDYYRKFLQEAAPKHPFRDGANGMVRLIKRLKVRYNSQ